MTYQECPSCGYNTYELETVALGVKVWTCSNCSFGSFEEKEEVDEFEDIPANRRKKEKQIANKIAKILLPKQRVNFRFVKKLDPGEYGRTEFEKKGGEFWKTPVKHILISEDNFKKKNSKEFFVDTAVHELPHASNEVRFNPNFDPYSQEFQKSCEICGEAHEGLGHDAVWHDKYLNYRGRINKKRFIKQYLKRRSKK